MKWFCFVASIKAAIKCYLVENGPKFGLVRIIQLYSNFTNFWYKDLLRNYKQLFLEFQC